MSTSTITPSRPAPLVGTGGDGPDGRPFPWGPITQVHSINGIDVVEYRRDMSNTSVSPSAAGEDPYAEHGQTQFHAYIDGRDTHRSDYSLDSALVGAIAQRREGPNGLAAMYFDRMTLPD